MSGEFIHIGTRAVWGGGELPFGLISHDRRQHLYVIGKTGTGKSTLLRNLILQDIEAGDGVALLDPHGDLAEEILNYVPPWRTDHLVYFNPTDQDYMVGFNILADVEPKDRHLVASGVVGALKSIWRDSWGPRLEYILYNCVASLCHCQNVTLLGVQRMLADERYRQWVMKQITDPLLSAFWNHEFAGYDKRFQTEVISPIQNKMGQLLMAPALRNILGQVRSKIDVRFMMDRRRMFIANLSKGLIGEDKADLLGSLLVTQFQLAAISRANIPERERTDFHLYVDEFPSFCTDSFLSILSEARKYRLCLTLSHQYLAQVSEVMRQGIVGNVGSLICFRVGESDARILEREFGGSYSAGQFTSLANFEVLSKVLTDGRYGEPFRGSTLPPTGTRYGGKENLIARSRERYATSRQVIEEKIRRWMRYGWGR
jgi:hypothetical protein